MQLSMDEKVTVNPFMVGKGNGSCKAGYNAHFTCLKYKAIGVFTGSEWERLHLLSLFTALKVWATILTCRFGFRALLPLLFCFLLGAGKASAQAQEVEQLIFNVTKLGQYKQILQDLQTGYQILSQGYNNIKAIASGNFNLHALFLDGLLKVNPAIAKYKRVTDIISDQLALVRNYKSAYRFLGASGMLRPYELDYVCSVYSGLVDRSLENLESLATVLTADRLRMPDGERLTVIDQLYQETHQMLGYLNVFNNDLASLVGGRRENKAAAKGISALLGTHQDN